jgi:hypothetical protein
LLRVSELSNERTIFGINIKHLIASLLRDRGGQRGLTQKKSPHKSNYICVLGFLTYFFSQEGQRAGERPHQTPTAESLLDVEIDLQTAKRKSCRKSVWGWSGS